jgi:hypothetical protein
VSRSKDCTSCLNTTLFIIFSTLILSQTSLFLLFSSLQHSKTPKLHPQFPPYAISKSKITFVLLKARIFSFPILPSFLPTKQHLNNSYKKKINKLKKKKKKISNTNSTYITYRLPKFLFLSSYNTSSTKSTQTLKLFKESFKLYPRKALLFHPSTKTSHILHTQHKSRNNKSMDHKPLWKFKKLKKKVLGSYPWIPIYTSLLKEHQSPHISFTFFLSFLALFASLRSGEAQNEPQTLKPPFYSSFWFFSF